MSKKTELIIVVVAVAVVASLFGYWYFVMRGEVAPVVIEGPSVAPLAEPASLGETIYEQSQNPIQNEIPTADNPVVNPIEGAYKNPFE